MRPAAPNSCSPRTRWPKTRKRHLGPSTRDAPLHGGLVAGNGRRDRDGSLAQPIDPAAVAEPHLEGGRDGQQPPSVLRLHQHAQSAGAGDVVGIARDGEELVERCVADGELRAEHAMHPCRRAQNCLVRQHLLAAAHERTVAPRDDALLLAQDDVAAVRSSRNKERQKLVAVPSRHACAGGSATLIAFSSSASATAERASCSRLRGGADRATSRSVQSLLALFDGVNLAQVGVARRRRMVGLERSQKTSKTSSPPGSSVTAFDCRAAHAVSN